MSVELLSKEVECAQEEVNILDNIIVFTFVTLGSKSELHQTLFNITLLLYLEKTLVLFIH